MEPTRRPGMSSTGIYTAEAGKSRILSFDEPSRSRHKTTIRATAMMVADPASQALQDDLDRISPSDVTVLVCGETGTGKELVSRYIHAHSDRRDGPFVAVNCGALTDSLAEAELFGHEKGAFTGALKTQHGWFEAAQGGTLLLDEIGDLPMALQVKLLRVLQEQEVTRVGSREAIPINVRVIAATNVDLQAAVRAKQFREDLFFRLNVATVSILPLRERRSDIAPLCDHFLSLYRARLGRHDLQFGSDALRLLQSYDWPGNIRELENVVHNAVLLARGTQIEREDLKIAARPDSTTTSITSFEAKIGDIVERAIASGEDGVYDRAMASVVRSAFELAAANQVHAAAALGISRNTLRTQLSRLGVIGGRRRPSEPESWPSVGQPAHGTLRIGYQKYGTSWILKTKGTLERRLAERGVSVSWSEFNAGPQLLDALSYGVIDFGTTGEAPPLFAQAAGVSLVYLACDPPAPSAEAIVVPHDSNIRCVADLRGKRIGLNRGSNVHYLLVRALRASGISPDEVMEVHLQPHQDPMQLLERGGLDAWVIWDPLLTAAQRDGNLRVLVDGRGLVPNRQFYLARRSYAKTDSDTIKILLDELNLAGQQAVEHSTIVAQTLSSHFHIDAPSLAIALRRMTYGAHPLDAQVIAEQQTIADDLHIAGLIGAPVKVSDAVWTA